MQISTNKETVTIVGGGLVGTSIAVMLSNELLKNFTTLQTQGLTTPSVEIQIIEPSEELGRGVPYAIYSDKDRDRNVAMNNQPNNRMSYTPDNIHALSEFIDPENPESRANDFTSRRETGDFAAESIRHIQKKLNQSGIGINIRHIRSKATEIRAAHSDRPYSFVVNTQNGEEARAGQLIIADGHQYNTDLEEFHGHEFFFEKYKPIDEVRDALYSKYDNVAIRGTSQTMIDWMRVLDHMDYQGTVHAFSRNGNAPWHFDPLQHPIENDNRPYTPHFLNIATKFNTLNDMPFEDINTLFQQEQARALKHGIGPGIFLSRFINQVASKSKESPYMGAGLNRLFKKAVADFGNPTPKFNLDILEKWMSQDRLKVISAGIARENIRLQGDSIVLQGNDQYDGLELDAFFDAATFARGVYDQHNKVISPVLRGLNDRGFLKSSVNGVFQAGEQRQKGLYLAKGPATSANKWGIETFRGENKNIVLEIANELMPTQA